MTNEGILGRIAQGEIDGDINRWMSAVEEEEEIFSNEDELAHTHIHTAIHTPTYERMKASLPPQCLENSHGITLHIDISTGSCRRR